MFMRTIFKKLPKNANSQTIRTLFNRTKERIPNQWLGPKLKRALVYTGATATTGGLIYYLSQDHTRVVDMFGAHEHVPELALYPKRGGAKDLPIAEYFIDDHQDDMNSTKPRLVIIGSGWGAVSVLKGLDKDKYNVTVVSANNYFLFTPLLPSATVGTLELR
jgi:NADH dehydrogenase